MCDVNLARNTTLSRHPVVKTQVAFRELPFVTKINVRGDPSDKKFARAMSDIAGADLPLQHGGVTRSDRAKILWLGPDEWLIVSDTIAAADFLNQFRAYEKGLVLSAVDVSSARTIVALEVPNADWILAKGCGLDLHPRRFPLGSCAQTHLARVSVILERSSSVENSSWQIYVANSFAAYIADWLIEALRE
jgi:sarcosine oxidase subunit gamma